MKKCLDLFLFFSSSFLLPFSEVLGLNCYIFSQFYVLAEKGANFSLQKQVFLGVFVDKPVVQCEGIIRVRVYGVGFRV